MSMLYGAEFIFNGMGGAESCEMRRSRLKIAMIACNPHLAEPTHSIRIQQPERSTCRNADIVFYLAQHCNYFVKSSALYSTSAGNKRKSSHALRMILPGSFQTLVMIYNRIFITPGGIMGRLGAPLAVFRAFSRAGIYYRA